MQFCQSPRQNLPSLWKKEWTSLLFYVIAWGKSYILTTPPINLLLLLQEWGGNPPNTFLGSYRLEYDRSWTPAEKVNERERDIINIQKAITAAIPVISGDIENDKLTGKDEILK